MRKNGEGSVRQLSTVNGNALSKVNTLIQIQTHLVLKELNVLAIQN